MNRYQRGISASAALGASEKEFLLNCGYSAHQIEECADGAALLNLDYILHDWRNRLLSRSLNSSASQ